MRPKNAWALIQRPFNGSVSGASLSYPLKERHPGAVWGRKCNPFAWNAAENATPSVEFGKASAKNATPASEIASACVVSSIQQAFNQMKNTTPAQEMRSEVQPLRQKLRLVISSIQQAYTHVKNATPSPEMPSKNATLHQKLRRYVLF